MGGERIGIVGASGDLGQRLTVQACQSYETVQTFDIQPKPLLPGSAGIDERLRHRSRGIQPVQADSLDELIETASILHWTAPIHTIRELGNVSSDTLLIMHDSMMLHSIEAVETRKAIGAIGQTAVVHCIMNDRQRVVVAEESEVIDETVHHLKQLDLQPIVLPHAEHDQMMAESQAIMAVLHEHLADKLAAYEQDGLLTPSGRDLKEALNARAAKWTSTSLQTILDNPYIADVLEKMLEKTNDRIKK